MLDEALVDAYGDDEQAVALYTMLDENLVLPFNTVVFGIEVMVKRLDVRKNSQIVAFCQEGRHRQAIPILELKLPTPPPQGWEWIEAYRCWYQDSDH